jgi:hypothetical protein
MNPLIREKRKISFDQKRITPQTIRDIAKIIDEEASALKKIKDVLVKYSLDLADDSSFESTHPVIFDEVDLLEKQVAIKVFMQLMATDGSQSIEIQMVQTQKTDPANNISVSGNDGNWVTGVLGRLDREVNLCEKQPDYASLIGWGMFFAWFAFAVVTFQPMLELKKYMTGEQVMILLITLWVASIVSFTIINGKLVELWPKVELQTGKKYAHTAQWKRNQALKIGSAVIIPIIVAFIYDLLKFWLA